ncbi:class I SAM-dependent methyltransferase [Acidiferrimicrobium sp. IK]|uniref:class I SAM-dependent methyltransferase n=1 Tax=Acidiferrimicrobium sp. IK TaxID=2871700 RepID=UPI0021CB3024|nr:class I SAM-dependent methyltransferase [Acidiferrimicrobium sp. IK]MCU4186507.1 class I SAM-dependent methyltransferase [Acidiferrimicrobium sp. IK]
MDPSGAPTNPGIRERLLWGIDLATSRGLEIGPLHNPRLTKHEADVRYLDHASKAELREKYRGNRDAEPFADRLVDVDYIWQPGRTLAEVLGDWSPVGFVIASHVIEHVANPIQWLQDISAILMPGGVLSLVVPDRRYTFDARRRDTGLAQLIDVYLRGIDTPTPQQIFDHEAEFMGDISADALWGGFDPASQARTDADDPLRFAFDVCRAQLATGEYRDVHASTFTPTSLLERLAEIVRLGLTDLSIAEIFPTDRGSYEFFLTVVKDEAADDATRLDRIARARAKVAAFEAAAASTEAEPAPAAQLLLSDRERRLIEIKRAALERAAPFRRRIAARRGR